MSSKRPSRLEVYQSSIKLTVTTRESFDDLFGHRLWRDSRSYVKDCISLSAIAYGHWDASMSLLRIFQAVSAAGGQIHPLRVKVHALTAPTTCLRPLHLTTQTAQALSRLRSLELDIDGFRGIYCTDITLETILSSVKGLVRVTFSSNSWYVQHPQSWELTVYISQALTTLESHALRQIWLRDIVILSEDLVIMLLKHQSNLTELTMSNVLLVGSWNIVLQRVRDELRLDKFVMINLFAVDDGEFRTDVEDAEVVYSLKGGVEFNGQGKVMSGIDEVLSKWDRQRVDPDYVPSWGSATDMGHLTHAED
jgi:hypothetical protein